MHIPIESKFVVLLSLETESYDETNENRFQNKLYFLKELKSIHDFIETLDMEYLTTDP